MPKRRADDCDFHAGFPRRKREDRRKRQLYILISAAAVAVVVCGGAVAVAVSAVKQVARAARNSDADNGQQEAGPPVAKVAATELYRLYDRNAERADGRYLEKSIHVDGMVASVDQIPGVGWRVALTTGPNHARVHAWFDPNQGATVRSLVVGRQCSILGLCGGQGPDSAGAGLWVVKLSSCRAAE